MIVLADLQRQMANGVRGLGDGVPAGLCRPHHLPLGDPLSVYRNHHRISLSSALGTTFPTVSLLIGEEAFHILARRFLQSQPPCTPCLAEYGSEFGAHLDDEPLVRDLPYLADIARLDWAVNRAVIAPDATALEAELLSTLTPEKLGELHLAGHPSLTLLRSDFPLLDIHRLAHGASDAGTVTLDAGDARLMIWRQRELVRTESISEGVFEALELLSAGHSILSACGKLEQSELPTFFSGQILTGGFVLREANS